MKVLIKILTISIFVISCQNVSIKVENQLITFNLKELPKITDVKLSDLNFEDIEYVPLETNEHSLIEEINELTVSNDFFLAQYFNKILRFQRDGSFVSKIGTEGRGPNEFLVAHDVDINKKNKNIYIVSAWQRKFYVYSENGKFIRTFESPLNTTSFKITEDGILCYSINSSANVETSFTLIDTCGRIIKKFPNKYAYKGQRGTAIFDENLFYRFNDRLFKKEVYSDTVYSFENMGFKPYLVIEHGKRLLTTAARSDFSPIYLFENFINQKNLFEFGDYIYYEFRTGNHLSYSFVGSKKNIFQALINSEQGLTNDLDGGPNIWPRTIKDNNTIISWIDPIQLKTHVASEAFKNSTPKYPEKKKELEKLANSLKETDNPVLMMVRLKK